MSTTENMIVTENIGLKAPKEDAFYEVGYIAENNEIIDRKFADVGNLEDMNSEIGASTMVEALNLTFQSGNEKRGILASNLVAMGVEADASETWDILLPKVKDISTGVDTSNDTVVAEVLLEGYTAHDANQEQIVGTLPDKTGTEEYTATATLDSTNSELQMTIPAMGKYGTNNKLKATFAKIASLIGLTAAKLVKGNTILGITGNSNNMDTSVGTITSANQLLKGIIGCSDGKTYTGTVVDRRGTTVAATAVSQDDTYTYFKTPAGCYSEESMVRTENSNLNNFIPIKSHTDLKIKGLTATVDINCEEGDTIIICACGYNNEKITIDSNLVSILYTSKSINYGYGGIHLVILKALSDNPSLTIKRATEGGGVGQIIVIGKKYNLITDVTTIENENDFLYLSFSKLIFNNGVNKTNTMLSLSKQYHAYPNTDWTGHIAFEIGTVQESGLVQNYNTTYSILVSLT